MAERTPRVAAELTLNPPAENAIRELVRTFGMLERVMQPHFARFGITGAQWGVLRQLHRAESEGQAGLRLTDLGERLLIRPPSVTGAIDRLERMGLVARGSMAADLRAKQVSLTVEGRQIVARALEEHPGQIEKLMRGLDTAEQADLQRLLHKLGLHLHGLLREENTPAVSRRRAGAGVSGGTLS